MSTRYVLRMSSSAIRSARSGSVSASFLTPRFRIVQREGSRDVARQIDHYNLDAILAVGYRVRSGRGTQFRQWATARLGWALDLFTDQWEPDPAVLEKMRAGLGRGTYRLGAPRTPSRFVSRWRLYVPDNALYEEWVRG